jgi:hypothetical protein
MCRVRRRPSRSSTAQRSDMCWRSKACCHRARYSVPLQGGEELVGYDLTLLLSLRRTLAFITKITLACAGCRRRTRSCLGFPGGFGTRLDRGLRADSTPRGPPRRAHRQRFASAIETNLGGRLVAAGTRAARSFEVDGTNRWGSEDLDRVVERAAAQARKKNTRARTKPNAKDLVTAAPDFGCAQPMPDQNQSRRLSCQA